MFAVAVRGRYQAEVYAWNDIEDMEAIQSLVLLVNRQMTFAPRQQVPNEGEGPHASSFQPTPRSSAIVGAREELGWLGDSEREGRIIPDGRDYTVKIEDRLYRLSVTAEQGKVDINTVQEVVLHQMLRWIMGKSTRDAESLADCLLDWRDKDNLVRLSGGEDEAYKRAGKAYGPANKLFSSVDEMRLVLGMTSQLFFGPLEENKETSGRGQWHGGLRDLFTVYNGSGNAKIEYAPPPLRTFFKEMVLQSGGLMQGEGQGGETIVPPQPLAGGQNTALDGGSGTSSQVVLLHVDTGHASYRIWFPASEGQGSPEILRVEEDIYPMTETHVQK